MTIALYECGHWIVLVAPEDHPELPQPPAKYLRRHLEGCEVIAEEGKCADCYLVTSACYTIERTGEWDGTRT
jgi:hypothetical protein